MKTRCAWCLRRISEDREVFGISVTLREEAFREVEPGTVHPLYLPGPARAVPMIVVAIGSPAKREGKDAMFQVCSDDCGKALQGALQDALRSGGTGGKPRG